MATPKTAPTTPPVTAPVEIHTDTTALSKAPRVFKNVDLVPANWHIEATSDTDIIAANNESGNRFEGSMVDFKKKLRGE